MDLLTQGLLGATVGELSSGKKLGNKAVFWGAVAGLIPDSDTFFASFMDVAQGLLFHRGITHSIFFAVLFSPIFAWLLFKLYKGKFEFSIWLKLIFLSVITHPLLDIFTTYGTGLFEPFSNRRIGFGTISVVDLFYTVPLLFAVIIIPFIKRTNEFRYTLNLILFAISHIYLVVTIGNKLSVENRVSNQLKIQNIEYSKFVTSPYILTNFLWNIAAKTDTGYYIGSYNILNRKRPINFEFVPQNKQLSENYKENDEMQKLIFFSKDYYSIQQEDNKLYFYDLRYGKMHLHSGSRYIFSFQIQQDPFKIIRNYPNASFSKEDGTYMRKKITGKI
jgi:inner membrane protein